MQTLKIERFAKRMKVEDKSYKNRLSFPADAKPRQKKINPISRKKIHMIIDAWPMIIDAWHSFLTMILREAMLEWLQPYAEWKKCNFSKCFMSFLTRCRSFQVVPGFSKFQYKTNKKSKFS